MKDKDHLPQINVVSLQNGARFRAAHFTETVPYKLYDSDGGNRWSVSASYRERDLWILMTQEKWDSNAVGHSPITVLMATAASGSLSHLCKGTLCSRTHSCSCAPSLLTGPHSGP